MHEIPNSFDFHGVLCFPRQSSKPSYYFAPLRADLDRDANGRPMFNLIAFGATGYLMLTAAWQVAAETLEALRAEIAKRDNISDPRTIELTFAPARVARCDLLLGDGSGEFQAIATSSTSGMPPYSALFNVMLTEKQFAAAAAALNGRADYLAVEYDATMPYPVTGSARLVPMSDRLVPWLREYVSVGKAGFLAALEEAIEDGLASVELSLRDKPSGKLVTDLYDSVLSLAAEVLPRLIESWGDVTPSDLQVAVSLAEEASRPFRPRADLSAVGLDPRGMALSGTVSTGVERTEVNTLPLRVKLGFEAGDAPLAWIRLKRANSEVVLTPPRFTPAELPAAGGSLPLLVSAGYTNGTPTHRIELVPENGELVLMPEDVGLTRLAVDARPLAEAGARSAQMSLQYRPPQQKGEQRHSIQFRDGSWVAHRWLATPGRSLLRYLGYRWTATTADGRTLSGSAAHADSSDIVLS